MGRGGRPAQQWRCSQAAGLVRLLAPLFPMRMGGSGGEQRAQPYHKSVLDWLEPSSGDREARDEQAASTPAITTTTTTTTATVQRHAYSMDAAIGHRLLGEAAARRVMGTADLALEASCQQRSNCSHELVGEEMPVLGKGLVGGRYALRHAVAHLCQAAAAAGGSGSSSALSSLLHELVLLLHPGYWQQAFGAGEPERDCRPGKCGLMLPV